jgi:hypothetical protein
MKYEREHPYKGPHQHEKPTEVDLQIGFLRYPDWHPLFWPYNDTLKDLHPKHPQMSPHCIGNLKAYLLEHPNLQPKLCDGNERDMMKKQELMLLLVRLSQDHFRFETTIMGLGRAATSEELKERNQLIGKYFHTRINEMINNLSAEPMDFLPNRVSDK